MLSGGARRDDASLVARATTTVLARIRIGDRARGAIPGARAIPVVVRAAIYPNPPKKIAVVDYDSDLIRGMFPPRPVPEVNAPYQFFRQRVAASPLFQPHGRCARRVQRDVSRAADSLAPRREVTAGEARLLAR